MKREKTPNWEGGEASFNRDRRNFPEDSVIYLGVTKGKYSLEWDD